MPVVAIDTLSQKFGGGVSVARDLISSLAEQHPESTFLVLCSNSDLTALGTHGNVEVVHLPKLASLAARLYWEQRHLPGLLSRRGATVLLQLGGFAIAGAQVPQVCVWQNPNIMTRLEIPHPLHVKAYIWVQRRMQSLSMRKAALNVFLTADSVREASTWWPMDRIPHRVIHHGLTPLPPPAREGVPPARKPFLLAVGHSYFHKNYETLIDAMRRIQPRVPGGLELLIAGGSVDPRYHASLEKRIVDRGLEQCVRFLGPTPPAVVARLYREASVYVTTALLESFGLTPLEAMSQGLPVVAANASCIPEVCGDAALFCEPRDAEDVAAKILRVLEEPHTRDELIEKGHARSASFSWEIQARSYWEAIEECSR